MHDFPRFVSFSVTQLCGLKCQMCGQWGPNGHLRGPQADSGRQMTAQEWCRLAHEVAQHGPVNVLLRGGEPFVLPGILELIAAIRGLELPLSIDSNGVHLERFADDLAQIGGFHITVSVDGPEAIHDQVRGVPGTFRRLADGIRALKAATEARGTQISLSLNYTLSPFSLSGLSALPDVARSLGVSVVSVVPYYWVPNDVGEQQDQALAQLGAESWSWKGFAQPSGGIEPDRLRLELLRFRENLGAVYAYPFMVLSDDEYVAWFSCATIPVGHQHCDNPWKVLDVKSNGDANFCVDFPDYVLGNVRQASLSELWNGGRAACFRERLKQGLMPSCGRCGAKYMSDQVP